jgi:lipoprotein-anchoring transpeptidase ErfK/SrfK
MPLLLLLLVMCLGIFIFGVWMVPSIAKAASNIISPNTPAYAIVNIAKATPNADATALPTVVPTITDNPTDTDPLPAAATQTQVDEIPTLDDTLPLADTATPEIQPTATPFPSAAPTAIPTSEPGSDGPTPTALPTDTQEPLPTAYIPPTPGPVTNGSKNGHWIDVDLTHQMVYAYDGNTLVNSFVVSTGTWQHPTVTGQYHVYIKYLYKDMSGPGYYLPNVPYTMFFYEGYAVHGTYWHSNFGTPMSHGCVNLSIPDSEWVYNFSSVGTLVNVHY